MLYLYTSNQLEQLSAYFSKVCVSPLRNTFDKEIVIVQNAGMARWLSLQIADFTGISANIDFLFPAEFMWKLLRIVSSDISEQSQCTPETLQFHIMQELTKHTHDYPELHHYITDKQGAINDIAIWQLSVELSQIFDQYLFYRGDWIQSWENNENSQHQDDWQARLWVRCVKDNELVHWLYLQNQFKDSLDQISSTDLPKRVSFFSMPTLSPGYLDLLSELSQKTDVYLYLINPSEDVYWGNILSDKTKSKMALDHQQYVEVGNPLLASMGKQGRDFIHQLLDLGESRHESLKSPFGSDDQNNILSHLQKDIYTLNSPKMIVDYDFDNDHSITFNACHTPMREVEVLYDQILDILNNDSSLSPADIIVLHPDIETYAAYIEAVFSNSHTRLPFSIADRNPLNTLQLVEALIKSLRLKDNRFDVESVFEILECSDVRLNFDLDESQLQKCRSLARAANIRWGVSLAERKKNNLPATFEHTWKYALDSLLLGYALGEDTETDSLFETEDSPFALFSYNEIEGNDIQILSNLKRFTNTIFSLTSWTNAQYSVDEWLLKVKDFIQALFGENPDTTPIFQSLSTIHQNSELSNFTLPISFDIFFKLLQANLESISGSEKFLGHGITFCAMVPMRSVPFKVVAMMGMNDGEFPRLNKRHSFDRLNEKPRRGDRSKRDEDRYLFLESLLAARSKIIISYIGQSVKDNSALPPSILVSELLDTLEIYSQYSAEKWVVKHPLQAFSLRYFDESSRLYSYMSEYADIKPVPELSTQTFIDDNLPALNDSHKSLTLTDLIHFFKAPAKEFLRQRFSIQMYRADITLPVREPFELEAFKHKIIRQIILTELRENASLDVARANGLLPYGEIGDKLFSKEDALVKEFQEKLPEINFVDNHVFKLHLGDFTLTGEINQLTAGTGRVLQQLTSAYYPDLIDIWLNHVVLNLLSDMYLPQFTTFHSPEDSFMLSPIDDAEEILEALLHFYWQGLHFPLAFFPKTAHTYYSKSPENITEALKTWEGGKYIAAEKEKFENKLLYKEVQFDDDTQPHDFLMISRLLYGEMYSVREDI